MDKTKELINVAGSKFLFKASLGLNTVQETLQVVDQMGTPNFQISAGLTLLHLAVQYNRTDLVKALLERGADTEVKTDYGETPLDQAAWKGYDESAILLLKHGANVNCATNLGYTPLHRCAFYNHPRLCSLLLLAGADTTLRDKENNETPYECAVTQKNTELQQILKPILDENGNDIKSLPYKNNQTPEKRKSKFQKFLLIFEVLFDLFEMNQRLQK